jgi:hypothetical protein
MMTICESSSMRASPALVAEVPAPAFTVSIDKTRHLEKYKVWQFTLKSNSAR